MRTRIAMLSAVVGLVGLGFAGRAQADEPPAWSITAVSYFGSGCPADSALAEPAEDGKSFTVSFSSFYVEAGPGLPLTQGLKSCNLSIDVQKPEGWQFSIARIAWRGHTQLEDQVRAQLAARYSFPGTNSVSDRTDVDGPADKDFEVINEFSDSGPWSHCRAGTARLRATGTASVNNLANRDKSGVIEAAESSGTLDLQCVLNWRRCQPCPTCGD